MSFGEIERETPKTVTIANVVPLIGSFYFKRAHNKNDPGLFDSRQKALQFLSDEMEGYLSELEIKKEAAEIKLEELEEMIKNEE